MEREKNFSEEKTSIEMPTTSPDTACRFYLREIERLGRTEDVKQWIETALKTEPEIYGSTEEFLEANPNYEEKISENLESEEKAAVKSYSGYNFAWINSVARGFWDYEKMGKKTPELEEQIKDTTRKIVSAIDKSPKPEKSFVTFRGTNLDAFRSYGISQISDLEKMKGQLMLEQGFTSTALAREQSFVERKESSFWIKSSDIEIHYHIPSGSDDVIALTSDELSYSPQQTEVLIKYGSLSYVTDVSLDEKGHAVMDMVLVPSSVYDHA